MLHGLDILKKSLLHSLIKPEPGCFGNGLFEFSKAMASSKWHCVISCLSGGYGLVGRSHTILSDSVNDIETSGSGVCTQGMGQIWSIFEQLPLIRFLSRCPSGQCHREIHRWGPAGTEKSARWLLDPSLVHLLGTHITLCVDLGVRSMDVRELGPSDS